MDSKDRKRRGHSLKAARRTGERKPIPGAWVPFKFPDEEVRKAVNFIKSERPDLWDRWVEHERRDEGYRDIAGELRPVLYRHYTPMSGADFQRLISQVRHEARREAEQTP